LEASKAKTPGLARLVSLVVATIVIQLLVAALLKELALRDATPVGVGLVLSAAVALNGIRFLVWGYTHRHFPLSQSYPLTALFFPCILLVSLYYGETIGTAQIAGVAVILIGLWLMNSGDAADA
jgi:drug/metabolite transporter (DMT)-like permease